MVTAADGRAAKPETDAPVLIDALDASVSSAERERADLGLAASSDQRVLDALGTGGLLPPAPHVTDALAVLEIETITAWSGWQYLSMLPPDARQRVLNTHPHPVDGIVVNNPDRLDDTERKLSGASRCPGLERRIGPSLHGMNHVAVGETAGFRARRLGWQPWPLAVAFGRLTRLKELRW